MRIRHVAIGLALSAAFAPVLTPAHAQDTAALGWTTYDDSDEESVPGVLDLGLSVAGLDDETGLTGAKKCTASTRAVTKHASIAYTDATGLRTYTFFHDVTFTWNCKVVTNLRRSVRYEIYQPQYSFAGYIHNSVTPANQPVVTSSAQGRFGICQDVVGSVCLLERQPSITWKVDATGRATVKTTP